VLGVRGINHRVILRVSTLQIAADRGTGRNPGATNSRIDVGALQTFGVFVVKDFVVKDAPALCGESQARSLSDRVGLE